MQKDTKTLSFWNPKRIFYIPEFTTKTICTLGLLIAVTIVLSWISGYLRIGNISKLSISFVSVFIAAYAFGGITGGLVGVLADLISCFINPIGPLMIQITLIEFVFGFIYGLFFHKTSYKLYIPFLILCDIIQFTTNILLKTYVLSATYKTVFNAMFISRLPMCAIQFTIILVILILIKPFLKTVNKII